MKRGKVVSSGRVEMPDVKRIKEIEKNRYKYLNVLEYNKIKESNMKEKFQSEHLRRTKLPMKNRRNDRHKTIAINTWAYSLMRFSASYVKWTKIKLDEIDGKTRKIMALNKELHPRIDDDRLYVSRMERRRRLVGCKVCVKTEENSLAWFVKHHIEPLIVAVRINNTVASENSTQPKEFKQQQCE